MNNQVKPIPDGYHTITPHLTVRDAKGAIEFYKNAFGAQVLNVAPGPGGKVMHALLKIGDSFLMLNDEFPEFGGTLAPATESSDTLHVYIENVDSAFEKAVKAGAKVKMPVMEMFWGDRYGQVIDPYGHRWSLATHTRDMSPEEMEREQEQAFAKMPKSA